MDGVLECAAGREYDEGVFLYFLDIERSRANRSNRSLRLLLVSIDRTPGTPVPLTGATAARVFAALRGSLREIDVIGWYEQHRVAGAVLSARSDADGPDMSDAILQRVQTGLSRRLRPAGVRTLRVRVIELRRASVDRRTGT
jgi:hypothetical protein